MLFFEQIPETPEDPIFGVVEAFKKDPRQDKIFLGIGVYRNEQLEPVIMRAVKKAEQNLLQTEKDKEYLPIAGDWQFIEGVGKIAFGEQMWTHAHNRIAGVQTVGGTGALRLAADFLMAYGTNRVVISDPSWPNHRGVFSRAGFDVETYPYYDFVHHVFCYEEMRKKLARLEPRTAVIFQTSCHNPTGIDLSHEQWKEIANMTKTQGLIPIFDCPYQGFGKGLEEDLLPLKNFIETGQEFMLAYSCSKNFSLYNERVGALFAVLSSDKEKERVLNALKALIRNTISNPPAHGARIVAGVLSDHGLTKLWKEELGEMRERIAKMRLDLARALRKPWIADTTGLYSLLQLSADFVEHLKKEKAIYMTSDSRVNLAALNKGVIERLSDALH